MTRQPPAHPQPGFYEQLVDKHGFDPAKLPTYSHQEFMQSHNQEGWLGMTLLDFERRTGKFKAPKVRIIKKENT